MANLPKLGDIKAGSPVRVRVRIARCQQCGTLVFNFEADVRATDRYMVVDGRRRRAFEFLAGYPLCGCTREIWLTVEAEVPEAVHA